jgi:hypothetical protein
MEIFVKENNLKEFEFIGEELVFDSLDKEPIFNVCFKPLERKLSEDKLNNFMYMASYRVLGNVLIYTYKHRDTRRYLNLDDDGNCYAYTGNGYRKIKEDSALNHVFNN